MAFQKATDENCYCSATGGRPALKLALDASAAYGKRAELTYKIRKNMVQTYPGINSTLNDTATK
jgi:hypothetical protein